MPKQYIPGTADEAEHVAIEFEAAARSIVKQVTQFNLTIPNGRVTTKRITIKYFPAKGGSDYRGCVAAHAEFALEMWESRRVGNAVKALEQI